MDINKSMDNWRLISIKTWISIRGYSCSTDIRTSIDECPCMNIPAWISMWISNLACIIKDWHLKTIDIHMDNWIFGNPFIDMLWILEPGLGNVFFFCVMLGNLYIACRSVIINSPRKFISRIVLKLLKGKASEFVCSCIIRCACGGPRETSSVPSAVAAALTQLTWVTEASR